MAIEHKYQTVIDLLKDKLLAEFAGEVHSIVLFGSVARGKATADSDIDVLIITDASWETERRMHKVATNIDLKNQVFTQLVIFTARGFEREVNMRSWFSSDIMIEGNVLYDDGTYRRIRQGDPRPIAGVPRR